MAGQDIIVIGASTGGLEALTRLLPKISANIPAAFFIVVHMLAQNPGLLPGI